MCRFRKLRSASLAAIFASSAAILAACNAIPTGPEEAGAPDVFDRVRSIDLLPRHPHEVEAAGKNAGSGVRSAVFRGADEPPVAAVEPRSTAQTTSSTGAFDLTFESTPVAAVAKVVLGDILGVGYTIDPRVQGTVSLASGRPVQKSDILYVLENALRLSGVVLVRDTAGYRLIPLAEAAGSGNIDAEPARAEPGYGISVVPLQYVSAQTLLKLVDSFATKPGMVRADPGRNLIIIQGSGAERRAAIDTVLSFDADWMRGQSVGIFPVRNGSPEPIIAELEKIMDSGEGGLGQSMVKFQPVARMNAILAVTRKPEMLRTAETWIKRLDNADMTRTGVHVYPVKYGEARQIARVLNDVFVGGGSSSALDTAENQVAPGSGLSATASGSSAAGRLGADTQQSSTSGFGSRASSSRGLGGTGSSGFGTAQTGLGAMANKEAGAALLDTRGGSSAGNAPVLQGVRITADVVNNSLLIYASQENYQIIERTLRQVDRPQMQVAIDATVAEVTLNDNLSYGVQFFLTSKNLGLHPDQGSALNTTATTAPAAASSAASTAANAFINRAFPGFNFLIGPEAQPNMILDALHDVTDVKVLSNPSLVVIDNQVATLQVGDQVPISTGSANVLTANNTIVNTIDYRDTGIILRVVPRINANGNVRLDIEQEISNVANASASLTPTVSERKIKSSIAVASGQTVLLAGLIQERQMGDRLGIPMLDQIAGVRDAFSHTDKTINRTELIIFIRPQIIRDSVDAHFVAEELRSKLRGSIGVAGTGERPAATVR